MIHLRNPAFVGSLSRPVVSGGAAPVQPPTADPNLWGWWRSDTGLANNGTLVDVSSTAWTDQSGLGHHFEVQTSHQPGYTASAVNGKPSITFGPAGSAKFLRYFGYNLLPLPYTVFLLVRRVSWNSGKYLFYSSDNSGNPTGFLLDNRVSPFLQYYSWNTYGPLVGRLGNGQWHVLMLANDCSAATGVSVTLQVDNYLPSSTTLGIWGTASSSSYVYVGDYGDGGAYSGDFEIAAMTISQGLANQATIDIHRNWLMDYGGLTLPTLTNTPLDDGSLYCFYRADMGVNQAGGIVLEGDNAWVDQSVHGRNLDQADYTGTDISYVTNDVNGNPSLAWSGGGMRRLIQAADTGDGMLYANNFGYALWILFKNVTNLNSGWLTDGTAGSSFVIQQYQLGGVNHMRYYSGGSAGEIVVTPGTWNIATLVNGFYTSGGGTDVWARWRINNGSWSYQVGTSGGDAPRLILGGYALGTTQSPDAHIAAVIVSLGKPTTDVDTLHKNWLAAYGGLTL